MDILKDLEKDMRAAVKFFWGKRDEQTKQQLKKGDTKDAGTRPAVTGGKQMDGFTQIIVKRLVMSGVPEECIFHKGNKPTVPGFFRATKKWDLLVIYKKQLIAAIEFKSMVGSVGNNFNNRSEEVLGCSVDAQTAYREGAFTPSPAPWLGWLLVFEDNETARRPVKTYEPHYMVRKEFAGTTYAERYVLLCLKLVRERHYNATAFLMTPKKGGTQHGEYVEDSEEISFYRFLSSLLGHVEAAMRSIDHTSS